jgi:hypothetical protein
MCKVPLTSMHKPISNYHSALVPSPRSLESKSKKHNIFNKDINISKPTLLLNTINIINLEDPNPLLTCKILNTPGHKI